MTLRDIQTEANKQRGQVYQNWSHVLHIAMKLIHMSQWL